MSNNGVPVQDIADTIGYRSTYVFENAMKLKGSEPSDLLHAT